MYGAADRENVAFQTALVDALAAALAVAAPTAVGAAAAYKHTSEITAAAFAVDCKPSCVPLLFHCDCRYSCCIQTVLGAAAAMASAVATIDEAVLRGLWRVPGVGGAIAAAAKAAAFRQSSERAAAAVDAELRRWRRVRGLGETGHMGRLSCFEASGDSGRLTP